MELEHAKLVEPFGAHQAATSRGAARDSAIHARPRCGRRPDLAARQKTALIFLVTPHNPLSQMVFSYMTDYALLLGHKPPPQPLVRGTLHLGFSNKPNIRKRELPGHPWLNTKAQKMVWRALEDGPATALDIWASMHNNIRVRTISNMLNLWYCDGLLEIMCVIAQSRVYQIRREAE